MPSLHAVDEIAVQPVPAVGRCPGLSVWGWIAGTVLALMVGSWLIWLSAYLQRKLAEDDIRTACQHVMPETADRCFDTVVIQRGGIRR
jgi:hypothetical protein